jgi:hypothetical protein
MNASNLTRYCQNYGIPDNRVTLTIDHIGGLLSKLDNKVVKSHMYAIMPAGSRAGAGRGLA